MNSVIIEGDDLLKAGLRLIHAVGRGSIHKPFYSCLSYKGNPNSEKYFALVGKGGNIYYNGKLFSTAVVYVLNQVQEWSKCMMIKVGHVQLLKHLELL